MLLLASDRMTKVLFSLRPWKGKQGGKHISSSDGNIQRERGSALDYTFAICMAPASPILLNARLSDRRFLLADLLVERAKPIRRAPSSPIRLFRSDKWLMLDQRDVTWIWTYLCKSSGCHWLNLVCVTHLLSSESRTWKLCCRSGLPSSVTALPQGRVNKLDQ